MVAIVSGFEVIAFAFAFEEEFGVGFEVGYWFERLVAPEVRSGVVLEVVFVLAPVDRMIEREAAPEVGQRKFESRVVTGSRVAAWRATSQGAEAGFEMMSLTVVAIESGD